MLPEDYFGFTTHHKGDRLCRASVRTELSAERAGSGSMPKSLSRKKKEVARPIQGRLGCGTKLLKPAKTPPKFLKSKCFKKDQLLRSEKKSGEKLKTESQDIRRRSEKKIEFVVEKSHSCQPLKKLPLVNSITMKEPLVNTVRQKTTTGSLANKLKKKRSIFFKMSKPRLSEHMSGSKSSDKTNPHISPGSDTLGENPWPLRSNKNIKRGTKDYENNMRPRNKGNHDLSDRQDSKKERQDIPRLSNRAVNAEQQPPLISSKQNSKIFPITNRRQQKNLAQFNHLERSGQLICTDEPMNDYQRIKMLQMRARKSIVQLLGDPNSTSKIIIPHPIYNTANVKPYQQINTIPVKKIVNKNDNEEQTKQHPINEEPIDDGQLLLLNSCSQISINSNAKQQNPKGQQLYQQSINRQNQQDKDSEEEEYAKQQPQGWVRQNFIRKRAKVVNQSVGQDSFDGNNLTQRSLEERADDSRGAKTNLKGNDYVSSKNQRQSNAQVIHRNKVRCLVNGKINNYVEEHSDSSIKNWDKTRKNIFPKMSSITKSSTPKNSMKQNICELETAPEFVFNLVESIRSWSVVQERILAEKVKELRKQNKGFAANGLTNVLSHLNMLNWMAEFVEQSQELYEDQLKQQMALPSFLLYKRFYYERNNLVNFLKNPRSQAIAGLSTREFDRFLKQNYYQKISIELQNCNNLIWKSLNVFYNEIKKFIEQVELVNLDKCNSDQEISLLATILHDERTLLHAKISQFNGKISSVKDSDNLAAMKWRRFRVMEMVFLLSRLQGKTVKKFTPSLSQPEQQKYLQQFQKPYLESLNFLIKQTQ